MRVKIKFPTFILHLKFESRFSLFSCGEKKMSQRRNVREVKISIKNFAKNKKTRVQKCQLVLQNLLDCKNSKILFLYPKKKVEIY